MTASELTTPAPVDDFAPIAHGAILGAGSRPARVPVGPPSELTKDFFRRSFFKTDPLPGLPILAAPSASCGYGRPVSKNRLTKAPRASAERAKEVRRRLMARRCGLE